MTFYKKTMQQNQRVNVKLTAYSDLIPLLKEASMCFVFNHS